jgi:hypothetical protein
MVGDLISAHVQHSPSSNEKPVVAADVERGVALGEEVAVMSGIFEIGTGTFNRSGVAADDL